MNRETFLEMINGLCNLAEESNIKPVVYIVTNSRRILASCEDIKTMKNSILIVSDKIAIPYTSIEYMEM